MDKRNTFTSNWIDGFSLIKELTDLRAAFAEVYQRHAPNWHGESYATRAKYPALIDDWDGEGFTEGNNARTAVWACDWMLWVLHATRSKPGHTISKLQLAQLMRWYVIVHEIALWDDIRATFWTGHVQRVARPAAMRAGKAKKSASKKKANRKSALAALEWAKGKHPTAAADGKISFLKMKAAEHLGVHVSTFHRRLHASK